MVHKNSYNSLHALYMIIAVFVFVSCSNSTSLRLTSESFSVIGFSPSEGPVTGGTQLVLEGTGFYADLQVQIGEHPCVVENVTSQSLTCRTSESSSVGYFEIKILNPKGELLANPGQYLFSGARPKVTVVTPETIYSGSVITLIGASFSNSQVRVGQDLCAIRFQNTREISCQVPEGIQAGNVPLVVSNPDGKESEPYEVTIESGTPSLPPPRIISATPLELPQTGGRFIRILGSGFVDAGTPGSKTRVSIGNFPCIVQNRRIPDMIECLSPAANPGRYALSVRNPDGQIDVYSEEAIVIPKLEISYMTPTEGPTTGGALVHIYGTRLHEAVEVSIDLSICEIEQRSESLLICRTSMHEHEGTYFVKIKDRIDQVLSSDQQYTYMTTGNLALVALNAGFPIDTGESSFDHTRNQFFGGLNTVFHDNQDISIFYNSTVKQDLGVELPAIPSVIRYSKATKSWHYLTHSGWGNTGAPEDFLTGEWYMGASGLDYSEIDQSFYGATSLFSHFQGHMHDTHGFFYGLKVRPGVAPLEYYNGYAGVFTTQSRQQFHMSTWNAWKAHQVSFRFNSEESEGLTVLPHICCNAVPTQFTLTAARFRRASQVWDFWDSAINGTGGWSATKPPEARMKLLPPQENDPSTWMDNGGYFNPQIYPTTWGYWGVFLAGTGGTTYGIIHVMRYISSTEKFEFLTDSGWNSSGIPLRINLIFADLIKPTGVGQEGFMGSVGANDMLRIMYLGIDSSLRMISIGSNGVIFPEDTVPLNLSVNDLGSSGFTYCSGVIDGTNDPFVFYASATSQYLYGVTKHLGQWDTMGTREIAGIRSLGENGNLGTFEACHGYSETNFVAIMRTDRRIFAFASPEWGEDEVVAQTLASRTINQDQLPTADWDWISKVRFPSGAFAGALDVAADGSMLMTYPITNQVWYLPYNMQLTGANHWIDWNQFKLPGSIVRGMNNVAYILSFTWFEVAIVSAMQLFESANPVLAPPSPPMTVTAASSNVVDFESLEYSGQVTLLPDLVDTNGNGALLVADGRNARIARFSVNQTVVSPHSTWSSLNSGLVHPNGICRSGQFVYVSDQKSHSISKFALDGTFTGIRWGNFGTGVGEFIQPSSLACHGNLLAAMDSYNRRVQMFDLRNPSIPLYMFDTIEVPGVSPDPKAFVTAIAFDEEGSFYVARNTSTGGDIHKFRPHQAP